MKRNIIIFTLVGMLLLSACNALEKTEASVPKDAPEAAVANISVSEEVSEYENIIDDAGGLIPISTKEKYELSLDKFKFSRDINYHYAEVKSEINNESAKKQSVPVKTLEKASGKKISMTYVESDERNYGNYYAAPIDIYVDKEDSTVLHLFDNNTGKYMGTMRSDSLAYNGERTITDEEDFKNKALDFLKENVDLRNYEFLEEKVIYQNDFTRDRIDAYRIIYAKKFHGIPSSEKVQCLVWADGVINYRIYNEGMFDNVDVPEIDLKDVLPLATEKAECVLENIPEPCELVGVGMKDHLYYIDASGQLMMSFVFQYTMYTPLEVRPITYTEGIYMAIVID